MNDIEVFPLDDGVTVVTALPGMSWLCGGDCGSWHLLFELIRDNGTVEARLISALHYPTESQAIRAAVEVLGQPQGASRP